MLHGDATQALIAQGTVDVSGLHGTWRRHEDARDGRWSVRIDVGVYRSAEGFDGHTRWREDPSGGVHPLNGAFSQRASATQAWLNRRGWMRPDGGGATFATPAIRRDNARSFVVVGAIPRGGQPVELWFDATTHLLDRTVRTMPISTLAVRYDDYRAVGGRKLPFAIETHESGSSDIERVRVDRWTIRSSIDRAVFAAPPPPADATLDGETTRAARNRRPDDGRGDAQRSDVRVHGRFASRSSFPARRPRPPASRGTIASCPSTASLLLG